MSTAGSSSPIATVTAMFTDIVNSVKLKSQMEGFTADQRDQNYIKYVKTPHDELIRWQVLQDGGTIINTTGDGFYVQFPVAGKAVFCALKIQRALWENPIDTHTALGVLQIRTGLHTGGVNAGSSDFGGQVADIAARVMSQALGGQVAVSQSTKALVMLDLRGVAFTSIGSHMLKGLEEPQELFLVSFRDSSHGTRSPRAADGAVATPSPLTKSYLRIPGYELLRRVGSGAYGEVWLAVMKTGSYRAVKVVFRANFKEDRPFDREFAGIKKYEPISRTHPGLVNVLHVDADYEAKYFYYVMELADDQKTGQKIDPPQYQARTLSSERSNCEKLPANECIKIGLDLASALEHLHQNGLVHRDIKLSNIIFVGGKPKLADIGLVADAGDPITFVGTAGYVPPEGPGRPQADIYSLGMVLYEISTGKDRDAFPDLPTDAGTTTTSDTNNELYRRLMHVTLKACERNVANRYQSAQELYNDLKQLLTDPRTSEMLKDAHDAFDRSHYDHARQELEAVLKSYPNHPKARQLLERIEHIEKEIKSAKGKFESGHFKEARRSLRTVARLAPNDTAAKGLADLVDKIEPLLADAQFAYDNDDCEKAGTALAVLDRLAPTHVTVIDYRHKVELWATRLLETTVQSFNVGAFAKARDVVADLLQLFPSHADALVLEQKMKLIEDLLSKTQDALCTKDTKTIADARARLLAVAPQNPKVQEFQQHVGQFVEGLLDTAAASFRRGDFDGVRTTLTNLLTVAPGHTPANELLAKTNQTELLLRQILDHYNSGDCEQVGAALPQLRALAEDCSKVQEVEHLVDQWTVDLLNKAGGFVNQYNYKDARECLSGLSALDPERDEAETLLRKIDDIENQLAQARTAAGKRDFRKLNECLAKLRQMAPAHPRLPELQQPAVRRKLTFVALAAVTILLLLAAGYQFGPAALQKIEIGYYWSKAESYRDHDYPQTLQWLDKLLAIVPQDEGAKKLQSEINADIQKWLQAIDAGLKDNDYHKAREALDNLKQRMNRDDRTKSSEDKVNARVRQLLVKAEELYANDKDDDARKEVAALRILSPAQREADELNTAIEKTAAIKASFAGAQYASARQTLETLRDLRKGQADPRVKYWSEQLMTRSDELLKEGQQAFAKGDYGKARTAYLAVIDLSGAAPTARLAEQRLADIAQIPSRLGAAKEAFDKAGYADARKALDDVLRMNPADPKAAELGSKFSARVDELFASAEINFKKEKDDDALAQLQQAADLAGARSPQQEKFSLLRNTIDEIRKKLRAVTDAFEQGNYPSATTIANAVIQLDSRPASQAQIAARDHLKKIKDITEAVVTLQQAIPDKKQGDPFAGYTTRDYSNLRVPLDRILSCNPKDPWARKFENERLEPKIAGLSKQAAENFAAGNYTDAHAKAELLLALAPNDPRAKNIRKDMDLRIKNLGQEAREQWGKGNMESADKALIELLRLDPSNASAMELRNQMHADYSLGDISAQKLGLTEGEVCSILFDRDDIVSVCARGNIGLWQLQGNKLVRAGERQLPDGVHVSCAALSYDSTLLATINNAPGKEEARNVFVWDWPIRPGARPRVLQGHDGPVQAITFFPQASVLVSASADKTIKVWDLGGGQNVALKATLSEHVRKVSCLAMSRDGTLLASGSDDGTVKLWDARAFQCVSTSQRYNEKVTAVAFRLDGRYLVSAIGNNLMVWSIENQKLKEAMAKPIVTDQQTGRVSLLYDNSIVTTAEGSDAPLTQWRCDPDTPARTSIKNARTFAVNPQWSLIVAAGKYEEDDTLAILKLIPAKTKK